MWVLKDEICEDWNLTDDNIEWIYENLDSSWKNNKPCQEIQECNFIFSNFDIYEWDTYV